MCASFAEGKIIRIKEYWSEFWRRMCFGLYSHKPAHTQTHIHTMSLVHTLASVPSEKYSIGINCSAANVWNRFRAMVLTEKHMAWFEGKRHEKHTRYSRWTRKTFRIEQNIRCKSHGALRQLWCVLGLIHVHQFFVAFVPNRALCIRAPSRIIITYIVWT